MKCGREMREKRQRKRDAQMNRKFMGKDAPNAECVLSLNATTRHPHGHVDVSETTRAFPLATSLRFSLSYEELILIL